MINLTQQGKNNLFWFIIVPFLILITIFISLSPWLSELLATPNGRMFTGINRWSTDYFIYLSYVEQGIKGQLPVKLLLTTKAHPAVFSFLSYSIPGFVFGHLFGLNNVFIYHLFRTIYGIFFLLTVIMFFYRISRSKIITILSFIFSFYISGFVKIESLFPLKISRYLSWLQEQNIIGRATGPLHYNTGFIIFLLALIYFFYINKKPLKKILVFGIYLNLLLLTNPFNYQLMVFSFAIYLTIKFVLIRNKYFIQELLTIIGAFSVSIPIFYYLYYHLSNKPWGVIGVSPKFYLITTPPINLSEIAFSVGPIFFLGIAGILLFTHKIILKIIKTGNIFLNSKSKELMIEAEGNPSLNIFVIIFFIIWPIIQFILLIFGDKLKIHPPRAFSGLYFLPLSFFSSYFVIYVCRLIRKKWSFNYIITIAVLILTLFLITFPNYYMSYKESLYAFTNFKDFTLLAYPTDKKMEAYKFLERNTPYGAGVLAMFEASNHIMAFSADATELNMDHQTKVIFYSNQLTNDQALSFLIDNHFQYVYFGYQEQSAGGNPEKYFFLKKIFDNQEVKIYEVK